MPIFQKYGLSQKSWPMFKDFLVKKPEPMFKDFL